MKKDVRHFLPNPCSGECIFSYTDTHGCGVETGVGVGPSREFWIKLELERAKVCRLRLQTEVSCPANRRLYRMTTVNYRQKTLQAWQL